MSVGSRLRGSVAAWHRHAGGDVARAVAVAQDHLAGLDEIVGIRGALGAADHRLGDAVAEAEMLVRWRRRVGSVEVTGDRLGVHDMQKVAAKRRSVPRQGSRAFLGRGGIDEQDRVRHRHSGVVLADVRVGP